MPSLNPPDHQEITVFRDGPFFLTAKVKIESDYFILKQAVDDTPEFKLDDGQTYTPSDRLEIEIAALEHLTTNKSLIKFSVPEVVAKGKNPLQWCLRADVHGTWLGRMDTPFFYADGALQQLSPAKIVSAIKSLQDSTDQATDSIIFSDKRRNSLVSEYYDRGSQQLAEDSQIPMPKLKVAGDNARSSLKSTEFVLSHGEPYPQHLFVDEGEIIIIDWENARLDHMYADLIKLWIRAFTDPDWQSEMIYEMKLEGIYDEQLWRDAKLLSIVRLMPYLKNTDKSDVTLRQKALDFCTATVLSLLNDL